MMEWLLRSKLIWAGAVFVSFIAWLEPSAWLANEVNDFAWMGFTEWLSGSIGSHALLLGCCWTLLGSWVLWANYTRPISILKYLGLVGLVVLGGGAVMAADSLAARYGFVTNRFVYAAMPLGVLFLELLLSVFIGKKLFKSCFVEGQFLGYLRVLAIGFTGLMAIKLGLFILIPGTYIRLSQPLFGG